MQFISTRGSAPPASFSDVLLAGLAPDGGLYLPQNWPQQRLAVAMDNLRGFIPDAVMVRVSTYGNNREAALAKVDDFIRTLMASVAPNIRRVFVG